MTRICRIALATFICVGVFSLTLPLRATAMPHHVMTSCCKHKQPSASAMHHHHCGDAEAMDRGCGADQPQKMDDQQCCAACGIGLSLFADATTPLIFAPAGSEKLAIDSIAELFRSERPPVPPPRAWFA